jgi:hypothetical protein
MPTPRSSIYRAAATACLLFAGTGGHANAQSVDAAAANWTAIAACASKPDERSRHTCMDGVLRQAGVLSAERQATERRARFGTDAQPVPPQAPDAPAAEPVDERVEVQLATVTVTSDEKLIVTTTDGVVWRQRDSDPVRPRPAAGDRMIVRKALLGSFLCTVRQNVAYRCSRGR